MASRKKAAAKPTEKNAEAAKIKAQNAALEAEGYVTAKILTPIAGSNFSYAPNELVQLRQSVFEKWEKAGLCAKPAEDLELKARQVQLEHELSEVTEQLNAQTAEAAALRDLVVRYLSAEGDARKELHAQLVEMLGLGDEDLQPSLPVDDA